MRQVAIACRRLKRARTRSHAYEIVCDLQDDLGRLGDEWLCRADRYPSRSYERTESLQRAARVLTAMETLARVRSDIALGEYSVGDAMTHDGRDWLCWRMAAIVVGLESVEDVV